MPNLPDDQFERYLKQFRPLNPEQMVFENQLRPRRRQRAVAAVGAAAVMIVAFVIVHFHSQHLNQRDGQRTAATRIKVPQPLTIRSADALLADAPSFKAAVDVLTVPSPSISFGVKQSALDVLGKDSKL